jgi:hypothetical protein
MRLNGERHVSVILEERRATRPISADRPLNGWTLEKRGLPKLHDSIVLAAGHSGAKSGVLLASFRYVRKAKKARGGQDAGHIYLR